MIVQSKEGVTVRKALNIEVANLHDNSRVWALKARHALIMWGSILFSVFRTKHTRTMRGSDVNIYSRQCCYKYRV